ncbi:MAG: hypothetical protein ABUL71_04680 [Gemmatimonadota bacterium]
MRLWMLGMATIASGLTAQVRTAPRLGPPVAVRSTVEYWRGMNRSAVVLSATNDTTMPMAITRIELSNCRNVAIRCDTVLANVTVIAPHASQRLLSVPTVSEAMPGDFEAALSWRVATECLGTLADSSARQLPTAISLIVPPMTGAPKVASVQVRFFVSPAGAVDSVQADALTDVKFRKSFLDVMRKYQFEPAHSKEGCAVAAEFVYMMSFGYH